MPLSGTNTQDPTRILQQSMILKPWMLGQKFVVGFLALFLCTVATSHVAVAGPASLSPEERRVDVEEKLGARIATQIPFIDHEGNEVTLAKYFDGERPVLLTLNYYRCPTLCNVQLNELTKAFKILDWIPGDEHFRVVTVSIDPRENVALASDKRDVHLSALGKGKDVDWSFLTGDAGSIRLLANQLGFRYAYDKSKDQYAHPPVIMFLSPDGKIARYIYGLSYKTNDLRFALIEASEGKVGTTVERVILSCFHYDSTQGRYTPFAFGLLRVAAVLIVLIVGIPLAFVLRRERKLERTIEKAHAQHNSGRHENES